MSILSAPSTYTPRGNPDSLQQISPGNVKEVKTDVDELTGNIFLQAEDRITDGSAEMFLFPGRCGHAENVLL